MSNARIVANVTPKCQLVGSTGITLHSVKPLPPHVKDSGTNVVPLSYVNLQTGGVAWL